MATIHQFDNNPEEDEFYLVEIYWFITYTLVEPSINQQFNLDLETSKFDFYIVNNDRGGR